MTPHNLEAERALLGAIMIDDAEFDNIIEHVNTPEAFYGDINQEIFALMLELKAKRQNFDLVTIGGMLPKAVEYIAALTTYAISSAHAEDYARQVADKYLRRELFRACQEGVKIATDEREYDAPGAASAIDSLIAKAGKGLKIGGASLSKLTHERITKYLQDKEAGIYWEGVKTGFYDLDRLIDGFAWGENIILAARPSMGKTALALNISLNVAKAGTPVYFFSMEMSKERLTDRLLSTEGMIPAKRMKTRSLTGEEESRMEEASDRLHSLPFYIYDGTMNTAQIRSVLARAKGKALAVIDFLTLLTDNSNLPPHERYGGIAKTIQGIAGTFGMPTLTLAQLNRKVEERTKKRPILSDLRESGNLEEAADKVLFIYREDYYEADTQNKGIAEIICAKNRDGETGTEELLWRPDILRFASLARRC